MQEWMSKDCCSVPLHYHQTFVSLKVIQICQDEHFDITKGCLLACPDKKKYYCDACVSKSREQWGDDQGRVRCPFCRQPTYFVCAKWIFVNDEAKRQEAKKEKANTYQKSKKSRKRQQVAEGKRKARLQQS
ncbi:hypothetical protein PM082_009958 [Marasmius tenuissimus]|nr:hypothetical protein PM082_009958 [Marasmius tenuissimus]